MKKPLSLLVFFIPAIVGLVVLQPKEVMAHPGNTDSMGGHYCWTNCEKWGLTYGQYHFHDQEEKTGGIDVYFDTLSLVEKTKADVKGIAERWGYDALCEGDLLTNMIDYGLDSLIDRIKMSANFKSLPEYSYCEADYACSTDMKYLEDSDLLLAGMLGWMAAVNDKSCGTQSMEGIRKRLSGNTDLVKTASSSGFQAKSSTSSVKSKTSVSSASNEGSCGPNSYFSRELGCKCNKGFAKEGGICKAYTPVFSVDKTKCRTIEPCTCYAGYVPQANKRCVAASSSSKKASTVSKKSASSSSNSNIVSCSKSGTLKTCQCPAGFKPDKSQSKCLKAK